MQHHGGEGAAHRAEAVTLGIEGLGLCRVHGADLAQRELNEGRGVERFAGGVGIEGRLRSLQIACAADEHFIAHACAGDARPLQGKEHIRRKIRVRFVLTERVAPPTPTAVGILQRSQTAGAGLKIGRDARREFGIAQAFAVQGAIDFDMRQEIRDQRLGARRGLGRAHRLQRR